MTGISEKAPRRVGVLLCRNVQLLDTAAVDLLGMLAPKMIRTSGLEVSDDVAEKGQNFDIRYVAESGPGSHAELTAGMKCIVTVSS